MAKGFPSPMYIRERYICFWLVALFIMATIICYRICAVRPTPVPKVGYQHCTWVKPKTKTLQSHKTPPWFFLLADYGDTIRSGRNLYVWPSDASKLRLGNKLFNYAATFGIAWRNRRIPIWPRNRISRKYDITKFFNLRIPAVQMDSIIQVSYFVD